MSDITLRNLVLARLEKDTEPEDEWAALVLAAREGPEELAQLPFSSCRITAQGFRGIGPEATLDLTPGPGLTLVERDHLIERLDAASSRRWIRHLEGKLTDEERRQVLDAMEAGKELGDGLRWVPTRLLEPAAEKVARERLFRVADLLSGTKRSFREVASRLTSEEKAHVTATIVRADRVLAAARLDELKALIVEIAKANRVLEQVWWRH